jgi:hypothetical protein
MASRFRYALILLVATLLFWPIHTAQAQSIPDRETYLAWLREAYSAAQRNDLLGLREVAPRLYTSSALQVEGEQIPLDNSWLRTALQAEEPDLEMISLRLGALIDILDQPLTPVSASALEDLETILARIAPPQEPKEPSWFERLLTWLWQQLERINLPDPSPRTSAPLAMVGNAVVWIVAILIVLILVALIFYVASHVRREVVRESKLKQEHEEQITSSVEAKSQASLSAQSGDYRTAVRYMYLAALLHLHERGLINYDRTLTNYEYLSRLQGNNELRKRLIPIIDTFDRVWYGALEIDDQSFEEYRKQVEALRS